jgi:branched-chain amino acid transport system ATP-binding protein
MVEPLLVLDQVTKRFGALTVADAVELTVGPHEIHAVIGPNGAGKTTLIAQISGLLSPDSGRILFEGDDITRLPTHARAHLGIARSFQITEILPDFTVLENVALAAQARDGSSFRFFRPAYRDDALNRCGRQALELVGLAKRETLPARNLSHGEKRALELAIALVQEPKLLLLDEPTAGTGREETRQIVAMLDRLRGRYGILLIEHDMQAVFALADRISVMVYGRIIATGTPVEIRENPDVRQAYLGDEELV